MSVQLAGKNGQCGHGARAGFAGPLLCAVLTTLLAGTAQATVPAVTYTDLYMLGLPAGLSSGSPISPLWDFGVGGQTAARGQVIGSGSGTGGQSHALLWTSSVPSGIDLHPTGFAASYVVGTSGAQQVGAGYGSATGYYTHALLWSNSAASFVDLNPSGFLNSQANGTTGTQQVGFGEGSMTFFGDHALLWSGSAASFVDLNPPGFSDSFAYGASGTQQVGYGVSTATGILLDHALLWSGSADSYVDLNPNEFSNSYAYGVSGRSKWATATDRRPATTAMLCSGAARAVASLTSTPAGLRFPTPMAPTAHSRLAAATVRRREAMSMHCCGKGRPTDCVDLHSVLPALFTDSYAYWIDGDTVYGLALDDSGNYHAIEWTILPEPGSLGLIGLAMLAWAGRRRRTIARGVAGRVAGKGAER